MKKIIIFCLVVIAVVLSICQLEMGKQEYLVSLWPVDDMPLYKLGMIDNIELKTYSDKSSTITYNIVSKDILENMISRCSEFLTGEWIDLGKDKPLVIENGIIRGNIPASCSIDISDKHMKTSFQMQMDGMNEFISRIYKEKSLGKVLPLHELLNNALVKKHLIFYMEEYITLSYVYELDDDSIIKVMEYYKDSLDKAAVSKAILNDSENEQSITAYVDGVDIRVSILDDGRIEIFYVLVD